MSIGQISILAGTFVAAILLSRIVRLLMQRYIKAATAILHVDHTRYNFLKNAISLLTFSLAFTVVLLFIPQLKTLGIGLFAGAGIFTAIMAFASQQAFSNIISGIFIVIFKPFSVGDVIKIGAEQTGAVEDITLRHTVIRNFENRRIIIPNSVISSETILNSHIIDEKICNFLELQLQLNTNSPLVRELIRQAAEAHPNFLDNRTEEEIADGQPAIVFRIINIHDYSYTIRAYIWSENSAKGFAMLCDLRETMIAVFAQHQIEFARPNHRVLLTENGTIDPSTNPS